MISSFRRLRFLMGCLLLLSCAGIAGAQTAGDTCATAGVITTNGSYNFNTTGASPNDPCASIPTVWYRFTAPSAGTINADLCGSSYDTFLTIFPGNTCSLICNDAIVWNDNSAECEPSGPWSKVSLATPAGQSYYLVISGSTASDFGAGVLNFTFEPSDGTVLAGNDCANAGVIIDNGSYPFNTAGASADDPCYLGGPPAVWFKYTPVVDGTVYLDLCGSDYDTYLTVFRGPNCPLTCANVVAENDNFCNLQSGVQFTGFSGVTYIFAVSGFEVLDFGPGELNLEFVPFSGLPGDTCLDPHVLTDNGQYPFDTTGASPDEPCTYGVSSPAVWFRYDVTSHGTVAASACPGGEATFNVTLVAHVTQGDCPTNCDTSVAGTDACGSLPGEHGVEFPVKPGDVVFLTVSSKAISTVGSGLLAFSFVPLEAGDTCAEASEIVFDGSYPFDTTGASADNPCDPGGSPTVWYKYVTPGWGTLDVDLCGSGAFDSSLTIFASADCPVACEGTVAGVEGDSCGLHAGASFLVPPNELLYIAVGGRTPGDFGSGALNLTFTPLTASPTCATAPPLPDSGIFPFSNVGVAAGGDPCRATSRTVWYSFTAPQNGMFLVETCDLALFDTAISAFEGACPASCTNRIAFNDDAGGECGLRSRIDFPVVEGETYLIALSGFGTIQGSGEVLVQFTPNEEPVIPGDINDDGVVNVADVTELSNLLAAATPPPTSVGDLNDDGSVDELDRDILVDMIVND